MPMNPQSVAIMPPSQGPVHAKLVEERWRPAAREEDSRAAPRVNHSEQIESYTSTDGVCNELARIALNRSAVMQAYDSMIRSSGVARATARRSPPREAARVGRVQRVLNVLFGRRATR
jgi:hypothetical protein